MLRAVSIVLTAGALLASLAACSKDETPPAPELASTPTPAPAPAPTPAPAPPPPPSWSLDVGPSLSFSLGLQPSPSFGATAGGLLEPPGFVPLEIFGTAWLDSTVNRSGASGSFSLDTAGGAICPLRLRTAALRAYGCLDGVVGLVTARVSGLSVDHEPFLAGAVEGRVSLRVAGPFALRAGASALVPVLRHDFTGPGAAGTVDLFRASPVAGAFDLGLGVFFP
ncbi:MAG TPA: hypothetical protein VGG39_33570 [Polyangiaceae bacterium]